MSAEQDVTDEQDVRAEQDARDVEQFALRPALEAVLMVTDQPLDEVRLAQAVGRPVREVADALQGLAAEYVEQGRGFELRDVGGGWRFYSGADYTEIVERFVVDGQQARLTTAALETLAVISYRQPISRARVSAIRGVNIDGVVRTLVSRGLVEEAGVDPESGAHLFRTTTYFLERMGLSSLDELPEIAPFLPEMAEIEGELDLPGSALDHDRSPHRGEDPPSGPSGEAVLGVRLQKVLAQAGVASRRRCEELMAAGRVEVDGIVVTQLGARVDPESAVVRVDGDRIPVAAAKVYLVANKPRGVVSTMDDDEGRPDLRTLLTGRSERLFHVGRLDTDTDGLIVLTNDGEFAHRLAHPSFELSKTYLAQVEGRMTAKTRHALLAGVTLSDGFIAVDSVRTVSENQGRTLVEIVIHEGRNRIVRRLLAEVGHRVQRLSRTAIGPVRLGDLRSGQVRNLTATELGTLLDAVGL